MGGETLDVEIRNLESRPNGDEDPSSREVAAGLVGSLVGSLTRDDIWGSDIIAGVENTRRAAGEAIMIGRPSDTPRAF